MSSPACAVEVRDVMTREVVTIDPSETIENAARVMTRFGISSLIVKSEEGVQGIITERDVLTRVVASGRDPNGVTVGEVMTCSLISVEPSTPLTEAGNMMLQNKIKKLPVVESAENDRVLGILSLTDVATHQPELLREYTEAKAEEREPISVETLVKMDEGQHLEFKASLRFNNVRGCVDADLEYNCLKTICAFLNAEGGDLLIGVSDNNWIVGLETDYQTLPKKNRDGFENHLANQTSNKIGNVFLSNIRCSFHTLYGHEICRVHVEPSKEPAFLLNKGQQSFYVRTGNNSRPFKIADATRYLMGRMNGSEAYQVTPYQ
ncbi:CBS domain-containing protein [Candidatus Bathyarchaeota archaeon]|nr:CBS domain-containing protein [Candidatus Bathyarchaeota archaeon]